MLLSGFIFAVAHLDLVVLIPTFVLGCLLAYVYHRSNSLWPGIILHFLVNSFGLCGAYFASNYQNLIPA
jgi:membrane protease YdiL (CAAX protease family)